MDRSLRLLLHGALLHIHFISSFDALLDVCGYVEVCISLDIVFSISLKFRHNLLVLYLGIILSIRK